MPDPATANPRLVRSYTDIIGLIDRGKLLQSANEAIREALETLENQPSEKGKATITLALEFTFEKGMVQVKPKLTAKLPEGETFSPLVVWTHEGALSLEHPSQIDLFRGPRAAPAEQPKAADSTILASG
jgi:hypothetical protein